VAGWKQVDDKEQLSISSSSLGKRFLVLTIKLDGQITIRHGFGSTFSSILNQPSHHLFVHAGSSCSFLDTSEGKLQGAMISPETQLVLFP